MAREPREQTAKEEDVTTRAGRNQMIQKVRSFGRRVSMAIWDWKRHHMDEGGKAMGPVVRSHSEAVMMTGSDGHST